MFTKQEAETVRDNIRAAHPEYEQGFIDAICEGLQEGIFTAERVESGEYLLILTEKGWKFGKEMKDSRK